MIGFLAANGTIQMEGQHTTMTKMIPTKTMLSHWPFLVGIIGGSLFSSHIFAAPPQKIASLSLASDEILLDLLQTCGGLQRIVALSTFADDPEASSVVEAAKSVKGRVHSEPESLFALKPDLIIAASFNRPELIRMIESRKVPLLMLDKFSSVADIAKHIQDIGAAVECPKEAKALRASFLRQVSAQKKPSASPKKVRVINYSPDLVVMGLDTLFDDLVTQAGAINVAGEFGLHHWPKIDMETLLKMKPDKIIVIGVDSPKKRAAIKAHPAWGRLDAVTKENQLIFLDAKTALSTSHYFSGAIKDLQKHLQP